MNSNIMDFLSTGAENAKTAKELMRLAGYTDARTVTREIHILRVKGKIICSDNGIIQGFYLPANDDEVLRFYMQMKSRIKQIQNAIKATEDYLLIGGDNFENTY